MTEFTPFFWWMYGLAQPMVIHWSPGSMIVQAWGMIVISFVAMAYSDRAGRGGWRMSIIAGSYVLAWFGLLIGTHAGEMIQIEQLRRLLADG